MKKNISNTKGSLQEPERHSCCSRSEPGNKVADAESLGRKKVVEKNALGSCITATGKEPSLNLSDLKHCHFIEDFIETPIGLVPRVSSRLVLNDLRGALRVRLGIRRNDYRVNPGLYAVGSPGKSSPVLVTANFKLTFDHVRRELQALNAWMLVLDTRGVNVWCAAGKKTFSSEELIYRIESCGLKNMVSHRHLILPQLGASGVSALEVEEKSGFSVVWGPLRAADLPEFLKNGLKAGEKMRMVTFPLRERLVLIPVEIKNILKPSLWILLSIFVLSGIGREVFSFQATWIRGRLAALAYGLGLFGGTLVVPALLPWIPGRMLYVKGLLAAFPLALLGLWGVFPALHPMEVGALISFCVSVSSHTAMNFTGSTPFTSPSGVGIEVRQGLLVQSLLLLGAAFLWLFAGFST